MTLVPQKGASFGHKNWQLLTVGGCSLHLGQLLETEMAMTIAIPMVIMTAMAQL